MCDQNMSCCPLGSGRSFGEVPADRSTPSPRAVPACRQAPSHTTRSTFVSNLHSKCALAGILFTLPERFAKIRERISGNMRSLWVGAQRHQALPRRDARYAATVHQLTTTPRQTPTKPRKHLHQRNRYQLGLPVGNPSPVWGCVRCLFCLDTAEVTGSIPVAPTQPKPLPRSGNAYAGVRYDRHCLEQHEQACHARLRRLRRDDAPRHRHRHQGRVGSRRRR